MSRFKNDVVLPEFYNPREEEKKISRFWHKQRIFQNIANARRKENNGKLTLQSGPVFPTGSPHSGHFLNAVIRDAFTRYSYMRNLDVETRFGWDSHGLPVEHEVDKSLGIDAPANIQKMGIPTYNEECRHFAKRHGKEWTKAYEKLGNWIDFSKEYSTMDAEYMERVWGVFKELHDKGMVYRDTKVQPYSTGCFTNLSHFEAKQNCREVTETVTVVSVNIRDSDEKLLIWTTNPWALDLNSGICVNPKAVYLKVKVNGVIYIISKKCLRLVWNDPHEYEVLEEVLGESLKDLTYEPLFDARPAGEILSVFSDESIADDVGTGVMPVSNIDLESLKERGHIVKNEEIRYEKAYCWRSGTPLISRQVSSWFIRTRTITNKLLDSASQVNWSPGEKAKEEFTKWLKENSQDWSISRTRYWGTPIPIWSSPSGDEIICVGSVAELKRLPTPGNPPLRRVPEVFDCWFESAVVPFEHGTESFQADVTCEGVDQTHGWFYTTLVLATALSCPPPFRNIFASGLVLDTDGSKVSKRKHNNNDALRLIEKYGADAYRLYLISTPMAAGQNSTIQEKGVANTVEAVINPLYRIFSKCTKHLYSPTYGNYGPLHELDFKNDLSEWLFSCTASLVRFYKSEMEAYRVHTFLPRVIELMRFIEDVYIPLRYPKDGAAAHMTGVILFSVIYKLCLILAPFAPFITEYIYQIHLPFMIWFSRKETIHDALILTPSDRSIKPHLELAFSRMGVVMELVQAIRVRYVIPAQYRISELIVIHHRDDYLENLNPVKAHVLELVNAENVRYSKDHNEFGVCLKMKVAEDSMIKDVEQVTSALENIDLSELESVIKDDQIHTSKYEIPLSDIRMSYGIVNESGPNYAISTRDDLLLVVKMNKELHFYQEGTVKEVENRLRRFRKKGNYFPTDKVTVFYSTDDECLQSVMKKYNNRLMSDTRIELKVMASKVPDMVEEQVDIKGMPMTLYLIPRSD